MIFHDYRMKSAGNWLWLVAVVLVIAQFPGKDLPGSGLIGNNLLHTSGVVGEDAIVKRTLPLDGYFQLPSVLIFSNISVSFSRFLPFYSDAGVRIKSNQKFVSYLQLFSQNNQSLWLHVPLYLWVRALLN